MEWIGKELDMRSYLLSVQDPTPWTWLLLANMTLGLFLAVRIAVSEHLDARQKLLWVLFSLLAAPLALPLYLLFQVRRSS